MKAISIKLNPKTGTITRYLPHTHKVAVGSSLIATSWKPDGTEFDVQMIMDTRAFTFELSRSEALALHRTLSNGLMETKHG